MNPSIVYMNIQKPVDLVEVEVQMTCEYPDYSQQVHWTDE